MKFTNMLVLLVLATTLMLSACGETGPETTQEAKDAGYAYGVVIAEQLNAPQMGLTPEEKNIDKLIEGFKLAVKGDSATFFSSLDVIRTRMTTKQPSANAEEAANLAYNLGLNGLGVGGYAVEVDFEENALDFIKMKKGYEDQIAGKATMDSIKVNEVLKGFLEPYQKAYQEKMQKKQMEAQMKQQEADAALAGPNIEAGRAFLAENAKKEGVTTLPSGLQYEVIKEGTGAKPTATDKVKTHYHGTLIDGTVFDSSIDRGEPTSFGVGQVIKGWTEGLQLMKEGATYRFYIPHDLAYGTTSRGPQLPAGSTLIFDVELLEINPEK
jgi:FKBP-type peptidyl-prolyl cis-trans isomerase FklB